MIGSSLLKRTIRTPAGTVRAEMRRVDRGFERIKNQIESLKNDASYVKAGVLGKKALAPHPDAKPSGEAGMPRAPLTNVQLAMIHEFGAPARGIPERSFIRAAFKKHYPEYIELLATLIKGKVYPGHMTFAKALGLIGLRMSADMKGFVTQGPEIPPPNAPAYWKWKLEMQYHKRRKREGPLLPPRTLVNTGRMIGSITHEVVRRSGK